MSICIKLFRIITRADRKSQFRQCLGFGTANFFCLLAYESAEQKPKHCLTWDFLSALIIAKFFLGRRAREIPCDLTSAMTSSLPARSLTLRNPSRRRPTRVLRPDGGISSAWRVIRWNAPSSESLLLNIPKVRWYCIWVSEFQMMHNVLADFSPRSCVIPAFCALIGWPFLGNRSRSHKWFWSLI